MTSTVIVTSLNTCIKFYFEMLTLPFLLWINYTSLSVLCLKQSSKENIIPDALYVEQDVNQVFSLDSLVFPPCGPLQISSISCHDKSPLSLSLQLCDSSQKYPKLKCRRRFCRQNTISVLSFPVLTYQLNLLNTEYAVYEIKYIQENSACQLVKNEN